MREYIKVLKKREVTNGEAINILLHMLMCVVPLIVNSRNYSDSFYYPKATALYFLGGLILFFLIKEKFRFNGKIEWAYALFFLWLLVTTIFSMDAIRSIIGGVIRHEGLIMYLVYGVIFISSKRYFKISRFSIKLFLITGLVVSLGFIFKELGIEKLGISTIGNRNFLSSYLLMLLGFSITVFVYYKEKYCYVLSLIYFGTLIYTQTRGGWISLAAILGIFSLSVIKNKVYIKRVGLILIGFILVFSMINVINEGASLTRFKSIKENVTSISNNSGSGRIGIYKGAVSMILERPILGTGLSCFSEGFKKDAPKDVLEYWAMQNMTVDKAHNEILNLGATVGIIGVVLYLVLIYFVLKELLKVRNNKNSKTVLIIIGLYLLQANFNISVISVAPTFWMILGIASNIKNINFRKKEKIEIS